MLYVNHREKSGFMEYITITIAIIGCVLSVITFFKNNNKDDSKKSNIDGYNQGRIEEKLSNIEKSLEKIEDKLNNYDVEIDKKVNEALEHHIKEYHNKEVKK